MVKEECEFISSSAIYELRWAEKVASGKWLSLLMATNRDLDCYNQERFCSTIYSLGSRKKSSSFWNGSSELQEFYSHSQRDKPNRCELFGKEKSWRRILNSQVRLEGKYWVNSNFYSFTVFSKRGEPGIRARPHNDWFNVNWDNWWSK